MSYSALIKTGYVNLLSFIPYYFSVSTLLSTFFIPWKRYSWHKTTRGFDIFNSLSIALSNFLSIVIGVILRSVMLVFALYTFASAVIFGPPLVLVLCIFSKNSILFNKKYLFHQRSLAWDWQYGFTPTLDTFSKELYFEQIKTPFYGREQEQAIIHRTIYSKDESNLLIIADSGMGRHALLTEVAHDSFEKRFLVFDYYAYFKQLPETKEREGWLADILEEADRAGNIVLIMFNFENLLPFAGVFEKYLRSTSLHILGVATSSAYHKHIVQNEEIMKHFTKLELTSFTSNELLEILKMYSLNHYMVNFPLDALMRFVDLSNRMTAYENKHQPESCINLFDDFMAYHQLSLPKDHEHYWQDEVVQYLQSRYQIPITFAKEGEKELLKNLEMHLHKRVVNQNEAIEHISNALRRRRLDLSDTTKPISSFLFLGPTGVGKTETAKALAHLFFQSENKLLRLDMALFSNTDNTDEFMTSLIQLIRSNPYAVILLDELEKAHPNVLNTLLTLLDEGYITDQNQNKISAANHVIIATSNAASEFIRELVEKEDEPNSYTHANPTFSQLVVEYTLRNHLFSPEFINRFDAVVVYTPLSKEHLKQIAKMKLEKLQKKVGNTHKISFEINDKLIQEVVDKGYKPEFGARELDRAIRDLVENKLAKELLEE